MANILAIDAGFSHMGYAVIESFKAAVICGVLITEKSNKKTSRVADDYADRAGQMASYLANIISRYKVFGIVAELPSGGAQNAKAAIQMNMATAILGSVGALLHIPCEWTTPNEVKKAMTMNKSATKQDMMTAAINCWGGSIESKKVKCKKSINFPEGLRTEKKYLFCQNAFGAGDFEHIADALGAYMALSESTLIRMSMQKKAA